MIYVSLIHNQLVQDAREDIGESAVDFRRLAKYSGSVGDSLIGEERKFRKKSIIEIQVYHALCHTYITASFKL